MASEFTKPVRFPEVRVSLDDIRRQGEIERQWIVPNAAKAISAIEGLRDSEAEIQQLLEKIRSKRPYEDSGFAEARERAITEVKDTLVGISKGRPANPDAAMKLLRQFADVAALTESTESLRYVTHLARSYGYESGRIIANIIALVKTEYNGLSFSRDGRNDLVQDTARAVSKAGNVTQAEEISQDFLNLARQALLLSCLRVPDHHHSDVLL